MLSGSMFDGQVVIGGVSFSPFDGLVFGVGCAVGLTVAYLAVRRPAAWQPGEVHGEQGRDALGHLLPQPLRRGNAISGTPSGGAVAAVGLGKLLDKSAIYTLRKRVTCAAQSISYENTDPLMVLAGRGQYLYDEVRSNHGDLSLADTLIMPVDKGIRVCGTCSYIEKCAVAHS